MATGCARPAKTAEERTQKVREVVRALRGAFRACYHSGLESSPDARGSLKLEVKLAPDGRVYAATILESRLPDAATQECVIEKVSAASFGAPAEGHAKLVLPTVLKKED